MGIAVALLLTSVLCDIAVQTAEDDVDLVFELLGGAVLQNQVTQLLAHGQALLPLDGIAVLLAGAPRAGANGGKGEVRMEGEQKNETLSNTARGTKNTCSRAMLAIGSCLNKSVALSMLGGWTH